MKSVFEKEEMYWNEKFDTEDSMNFLPYSKSSSKVSTNDVSIINRTLPHHLSERINSLANGFDMAVFVILLTGVKCLLYTYTGRENTLVGIPAQTEFDDDNPPIHDFLIIKNKLSNESTFKSLLGQIKTSVSEALEHQHIPFRKMIRQLNLQYTPDGSPIVNTMVSYTKTHTLAFEKSVSTDTLFQFDSENSLIRLSVSFDNNRYDQDFMEQMTDHFFRLLSVALFQPELEIGKVDVLSEPEKHELLTLFNDTHTEYPKEKTIHQLFEEQAERNPDAVAVVFENQQLTYGELNERANRLARTLRTVGVQADNLVGLMADRSLDMIVGILAILKSGGAYVPIDPEYPEERIRYMIEDSGTQVMLAQRHLQERIPLQSTFVPLDDEESYNDDGSNLDAANVSANLAYIIYTSGTTGKPKGILTTHCNIVRVVRTTNYIDITAQDNVLQLSSYAFDGSTFDIFGALLNGAKLILVPKETMLDVVKLAQLIEQRQISTLFITTAFFNVLIDVGVECMRHIRTILFGGERVSVSHVRKALDYLGSGKIKHVYGPTESTVFATCYDVNEVEEDAVTIPIGRPISNTAIYIVNGENGLQPLGVAGELCVAGDGLARGYLNRPELTAEKFVDNPFVPGERMYRTGDLARWLADGSIEYVGRIDDQVKIRGYRIELGEVEAYLLKMDAIEKAIVVVRESEAGEKQLCAYFAAERTIPASELKLIMSQELPGYMIPSFFVQLESMPLTPNGKVDRKALPAPEESLQAEIEYIAPRTPAEAKLARIWRAVLGLGKVGAKDNFFDLGGHSLRATMMVSKLHKEENISLSLRDVFLSPVLEEMAELISRMEQQVYVSISPIEKRDYYPVSSVQKRLYILHQLEGAEQSYNMPGAMVLEGTLDRKQFEEAFRRLIARHETLRTGFKMVDGEPVQQVHHELDFAVAYMQANDEEARDVVRGFVRAFDLEKPPLLRVGLIELAKDRHIMMFDMHHIISDGTSLGIMMKEFVRLYSGEQLSPLRIQYKDYTAWQHSESQKDQMNRQESYWLQTFSGKLPVLEMPTDYARPSVQSYEGAIYEFAIDSVKSEGLRQLAAESRTTLYMVLLAVYTILLRKYTGQEDIIVGTPIAGRTHEDLQPLIGMFVNTLAIRSYPAGEKTFLSYLEEVKETTLGAFDCQDYPFEELLKNVQVTRDLSRNPLFDTMFALENTENAEFDLEGLRLNIYPSKYTMAKFDLNVTVMESENELICSIEFATALYKKETVERMAGHFEQLIDAVIGHPQASLAQLQMVTAAEQAQIMDVFNDTAADYPREKTIHELFEEQAGRTPEATAVDFENQQLTYRELNARANQLAWTLRESGVTAQQPVGIMVDRSIEMVVSVLAVLKAGGTFVPIDPEYPQTRIHYMLASSGARLVLTEQPWFASIPPEVEKIDVHDASLYEGREENLPNENDASHLLYIIYTSGTTGNPKGVMLEHRNLANLLQYQFTATNIPFPSPVLQYASGSFDVCYQEMFSALLFGGCLCLIGNEVRKDPKRLFARIEESKIEVLYLPVAFLKFIFTEAEWAEQFPHCVSHIITAGEQLVVTPQIEAILRSRGIYLHNHYGPSETHVVTAFTMQPEAIAAGLPPIGKPIANTKLYILDEGLQVQPIGIGGELYVSGDCVGRGYWGRPDLTDEKFVKNPFAPEERMYRTGDLARWLPDGNIEYLGRIDHQVKIRGFRIELGEVEAQLLKVAGLHEATVLALEDEAGQKQLCAYFVAEAELTAGELRGALSQELPGYMIPSYFVQLASMPLTQNGKIDRRALPAPEANKQTGAEFVAPRTRLEAQLARIWQEVLGLPSASVKDNFFELGGHSLRATTLVSKLYKELGVNLPLRDVFRYPTIEEMAQAIGGMERKAYEAIPRAEEREVYPLSSAQKRLYIMHQLEGAEMSYNMPGVMTLGGALDRERFEAAFRGLIARHETLRTGFEMLSGEPVQRVHSHVEFAVEYTQASEEEAGDIVSGFIRAFELAKPPLLRVGLIELAKDRHILMFDMHHIISDGVSMNILVEEFVRMYGGEELIPLAIQYKDYAAWQQSETHSERLKQQEAYWLDTLNGEISALELQTDYARPAIQRYEGDTNLSMLDPQTSELLRKLASETGSTLYMVLLAAYKVLLHKYSAQEDIIVGTPIAGRAHADLEPLIGMFVGTLAIRSFPSGDKTFLSYLDEIKEATLGAFEHQDYPFEELVEKVQVPRDLSRNPLFDTMFSLGNTEHGNVEIEGLQLRPYPNDHSVAKFDLIFHVEEREEGIAYSLTYATALYKRQTVERMALHFKQLVEVIAVEPQINLSSLNILTASEQNEILNVFNDTGVAYPREKTIHQVFEEQAERNPDAVAVVFEDKRLTYAELNTAANRIAYLLQDRGVGAGDFVGIFVERSLDMVIGLLGILKAGGAYVPMDPSYPQERIAVILDDTRIKVLLTQTHLRANLPENMQVVLLDAVDEGSREISWSNPTHEATGDDLAYIVYTSGSTGTPKGVCVTHRGVVRLVTAANYVDISDKDVFLQGSTLSFDAATFEIWGSLLNGATLAILPPGNLSLSEWSQVIGQHGVTVLWLTAGLFHVMVENQIQALQGVKQLLVGGDVVSKPHAKKVMERCSGLRLINGYGPTENTTFTCCHEIRMADVEKASIPIGRPIGNTQVYVLDGAGKLLPVGVIGELYIGGDGLAHGYLNQPELTAEKFVDNPFAPGERMYRTGDLARWLPDGTIEYVGRIDHQVKIRGYRIEIGEVESYLLKMASVQEAVVIAREEGAGQKVLCAYYVAERLLPASELRSMLSQELPAYMIPSYLVQLTELPLTPNGKVDRKVLPAPEGSLQSGVEYVAPRTPQEEQLARIWEDVLGIAKVGVKDNFFDLGGHSLSLMQLIQRVFTETGVEISFHKMFQSPTVEAMAYGIWESDLDEKKSNQFMKLNEHGFMNVFCFPPGLGYGLSYLELAQKLESHCILYGADYMDDTECYETMLNRYVDAVVSIQDQSPYVFMGYSLGGNLTFEVAKAMEKRGYQISDIIMIDSLKKETIAPLDQLESSIDQILEGAGESEKELLANPFIRNRVKHKMRSYWTYVSQVINSGTVQANIHGLIAEKSEVGTPDDIHVKYWNESTALNYREYQLVGVHEKLLAAEYLEENAKVIERIVHQIREQTNQKVLS
ncbi:amino acid adenylation domain-containing protein [Paenibacillus sp. SYP-B3998]|uniref:Amino acid adenylation domain-containing protein n=1 Tax=Paenibacillus sp. SYP-B3998 TaxID=2678564 RepID=A0A6G3ZYC4_9BACL|nr:non-ribosomal peptide synthetase [Paenibacillus sp. SYP-B3998]NEW06407.1 amino acid adenylation domain-containing protein [Paenibacillus sp. SYP-B3998]